MAGKHRAPSKTGPRLVKAGAVVAMASVPSLLGGGVAEAASPDSILAAIASCESGGRNVLTAIVDRNGKRLSTAGGYFQIVNGTWKAHGGLKYAPIAVQATYAEQLQVAKNILNGQGIGAWSESKSCWSKRIGKVAPPTPAPKIIPKVIVTPKVVKSAPKVVKATPAPSTKATAKKVAGSYLIKRGDTLSRIAKTNHTTTKALFSANRDTVSNPDRIFAGNHLRLR